MLKNQQHISFYLQSRLADLSGIADQVFQLEKEQGMYESMNRCAGQLLW